ncbi:MAG: DUF4381 domain-containing protein [Marinibacterium sp.]|nr:DUF4381 domain-containing protein [Marinibacterium sp.]
MSDPASHPQPTGGAPTEASAGAATTPETTAPAVGDSLVDLMNKLVLPDDPAPIPLTPETAGWWVLGAGLVCGLVWLARRWGHHRRANAYRRAALAELAQIGDNPAAIATLLRRTTLAAFPREAVAGLTGTEWIAFLQQTGPFPAELGPALTQAPYAPNKVHASGLKEAARRWIQKHKGGAA